MKLSSKFTVAVSLLSTITVFCIGFSFLSMWISSLEHQLGQEAADISKLISGSETVRQNLSLSNGYIKVNDYIERLRLDTRIHYIHVIDISGRIYSHPLKSMVGSIYKDERVLQALRNREEYVKSDGFFASHAEACSLVYYEGKLTGIVTVGLLNGRLYEEIRFSILTFVTLLVFSLIAGNLTAVRLSKNIKKTTFGLEPEEIASLLAHKNMILENLKEGIVTFDLSGNIEVVNKSAVRLLHISKETISDQEYQNYFEPGISTALRNNAATGPYEVCTQNGFMLLIYFYPMNSSPSSSTGVIARIEDLTAAKIKAEEITGIKQIMFSLRAQNHEFMNKLHTISGLVQMQEYDEAVKYIETTASARGELLYSLGKRIKEITLAGLLLSKYNKACEAKILMTIDEHSSVSEHPDCILPDDLCSLVGNLLENAIDELTGQENGEIFLGIYEHNGELNILIEDNGSGLPKKIKDSLYIKGMSTKGENRGFGLYIVKEIIVKLRGTIDVDCARGCAFQVHIPAQGGKYENSDS